MIAPFAHRPSFWVADCHHRPYSAMFAFDGLQFLINRRAKAGAEAAVASEFVAWFVGVVFPGCGESDGDGTEPGGAAKFLGGGRFRVLGNDERVGRLGIAKPTANGR